MSVQRIYLSNLRLELVDLLLDFGVLLLAATTVLPHKIFIVFLDALVLLIEILDLLPNLPVVIT